MRQAKAHIAGDIHVRKQGVILKHHAHAAYFGRGDEARRADDLPATADSPLRDGLQTRNGPQQTAFAAARRPYQSANFARGQI